MLPSGAFLRFLFPFYLRHSIVAHLLACSLTPSILLLSPTPPIPSRENILVSILFFLSLLWALKRWLLPKLPRAFFLLGIIVGSWFFPISFLIVPVSCNWIRYLISVPYIRIKNMPFQHTMIARFQLTWCRLQLLTCWRRGWSLITGFSHYHTRISPCRLNKLPRPNYIARFPLMSYPMPPLTCWRPGWSSIPAIRSINTRISPYRFRRMRQPVQTARFPLMSYP